MEAATKYLGLSPIACSALAAAPSSITKRMPLSRRSDRIPALPYRPLRCFQSGSNRAARQVRPAAVVSLFIAVPKIFFTVGTKQDYVA